MKKLLCFMFSMIFCLYGFGMSSSAAYTGDNMSVQDAEKFESVLVSVEPTMVVKDARLVKGYNYGIQIKYEGELIAYITGSVTYSIDNGKARVASASTPTVDMYVWDKVVTSSTSSSTSGSSAILTVTTKARSDWSIVNKTFTSNFKCSPSGVITSY